MSLEKFELEITGPRTAYLKLPTHPGVLKGARSIPLVNLLGAYQGPYVVFDFDQQGVLVGIEIVGEDEEEPEV
ncbi:uncharacterized protein SOCE26_023840 [Sorangium cellulosum]|uniref:DUF2283 domain-containing protein n=1 Tax=Sorangium cellulosum TaxID=56 RepID=A0A2L0EP02_SORCE|nr:DUF2283 domain-containing protein [Sorangium cellulosum]AUX40982.1 uncharacterized protein SOCE26_023840 [Sorangium cellulosum]